MLDTIGRKFGGYFGSKVEGNFSARATCFIYILCIGRLVFVVIAVIIAAKDQDYLLHNNDRFIESDAVKIVNLMLFSVTNGLVSTLGAIIATNSVSK